MTSPGIQSILQQMRTLSADAAGGSASGQSVTAAVGKSGFAEELHASIERINQLQENARAQVRGFESGNPDIALNDVMVDMQKASLAFEMGVQVRNRLVTAYKEIMNMQV